MERYIIFKTDKESEKFLQDNKCYFDIGNDWWYVNDPSAEFIEQLRKKSLMFMKEATMCAEEKAEHEAAEMRRERLSRPSFRRRRY